MGGDPDVDWSVFENAGRRKNLAISISLFLYLERYLLRDDSAWITRLSKDFWWNLERISEMITSEYSPMNNNGAFNRSSLPTQKYQQLQQPTKPFPQQQQQQPPPMQFTGAPPRKIVGQRNPNTFRNNSMFNNGFASPPPSSSSSSSSSGSTIVRPSSHHINSNMNIPEKSSSNNIFQAFATMSLTGGGNNDQDMEYNPFQSKISFDNNMWGNNSQQPIPWQ